MVARTLQFQQEQIASGNIPQGRVEQTVQQQIKQKREIDAKNAEIRKQNEIIRQNELERQRIIDENRKEKEAYEAAVRFYNRKISPRWVEGRPGYYLKKLYASDGAYQAPNKDVVFVEGQGVSIAPELQQSYINKQTSRGYKVETWNTLYTPVPVPQASPNLPKDELSINYEGYSVARERQAPFVLNRLAREQTALRKEQGYAQEVYYEVKKAAKQNKPSSNLLMTPLVQKINTFVGKKASEGYDFTKKEGAKSFDILYGKSGLKARREKAKTNEASMSNVIEYNRNVRSESKEKAIAEGKYYGSFDERIERTSDVLFPKDKVSKLKESISAPASTAFRNLGKSFPKLKTLAGSYFEIYPEQLIVGKGVLAVGDWLAMGKMIPRFGTLPGSVRVSKPTKVSAENPKRKGLDFKPLDKPNRDYKETKIPRRFADYSKPDQQGGIIFGNTIKKTYSKPKTVIQIGKAKIMDDGRVIFKAETFNPKKPLVREGYVGIGEAKLIEPGKLTIDKQVTSLLNKKRTITSRRTSRTRNYFVKDLGVIRIKKPKIKISSRPEQIKADDKSLTITKEQEQFIDADLATAKILRARGKKVTDTTDYFVKDLGIIRIKQPMREISFDTQQFAGRRITRTKVKGVQVKSGEGPLGETWNYMFNTRDVTYPKQVRRMRPTKVDLVREKGYPEVNIDKGLLKSNNGIRTSGYYDFLSNKIAIDRKGNVNTYLHELGHSKYAKLKRNTINTKDDETLFNLWDKSYNELKRKGVASELNKLGYKDAQVPEEAIVRLYAARPKSSLLGRIKFGIQYPKTSKYLNKLLKYDEFKYPSKDIIKAQSRGKNTIIEKRESFEDYMPRRFPKTKGTAIVQREAPPKFDDFMSGDLLLNKAKPDARLALITKAQMEIVAQKISKPRAVPVSKSKPLTAPTKQAQASVSAFYGKGTYERTEGVQSIMPKAQIITSLSPRLNTNLRSQSRTLTSEVSSTRLRQGLRSNEALDTALRNLNAQRETLRQSQVQRQSLRTPTKLQFALRTPGKTVITPRVPRVPRTPKRPTRIVRPFRFKIKSPKPSTRKQKSRRETTTRYAPSFAATTLNIRSKQKPLRTKGGYFFGFRPVLD